MTDYAYDNDGSTTVIFILASLVLYLAPSTFWRLSALAETQDEALRHQDTAFVQLCKEKKKAKYAQKKSIWTRSNLIYAAAWVLFFLMLWRAYTIKYDVPEVYNPYAILGLEEGANEKEIKGAYRQLSRKMHPDKNPDDPLANDKYMEVVKAHQALTDPAIRENWEKYGHPDGRRATEFGIALPSFIVSKDYKWPILGVYFLMFMVGLPLVVANWWSQSTRYTREQLLRDTVGLYYSAMTRTADKPELVEILCASVELRDLLPARDEDGAPLQQLIKHIVASYPELDKYFHKTKYNADYCIKAKALLWAHMMRLDLPCEAHRLDQAMLLGRLPVLLNGMMRIAGMRLWLGLVIQLIHLNQFIIQALDDRRAAPVLQLPHVDDELVQTRLAPKNVLAIQQVMDMDDAQRLAVFGLPEEQMKDTMLVARSIPWILADTELRVLAEDRIYTHAVITVRLQLQRLHYHGMVQKMKELNDQQAKENDPRRRPGADTPLSKGDVDVDWDPSLTKKEKVFHEKGHSFPVYCPYWPEDREEAWWIFIGDQPEATTGNLLTEPKRIDDLVTDKEIELYLPPVDKPGQYRYFLFIISDNYFACDTRQPLQFTAHTPPKVVQHEPSESESDDEMQQEEAVEASEDESDIESDAD
eukprot:comp21768_c0_seq1/m.30872 comp21768_c0_seq1/g.30872  ORF comp21768_c0_seq1/g.30872 comp21768_c0_seq1/m.30872 type:complete len:643 (-) comp21768_c0_seq1:166-2094(-)